MAALTRPLPLKVVATILGMGDDDDAYLADVTAKVIAALSGEQPGRDIGIEAHGAFTAHIDGLIEARSTTPGTDLISGISQGRTEAGERLSRQEIASFIALMMVAGGETTDRGLANFLAILFQHPEVLAAVKADPSAAGRGVLGVHAPGRRGRVRGPRAQRGGRPGTARPSRPGRSCAWP